MLYECGHPNSYLHRPGTSVYAVLRVIRHLRWHTSRAMRPQNLVIAHPHWPKPSPFFSMTYTRFADRSLAYPSCFESSTNLWRETPGWRPNVHQTCFACVTPIESISFKMLPFNPFRILLFHEWGGGTPTHFPKTMLTLFLFPISVFVGFLRGVKSRRTNYRWIRIYITERCNGKAPGVSGFGSGIKAGLGWPKIERYRLGVMRGRHGNSLARPTVRAAE